MKYFLMLILIITFVGCDLCQYEKHKYGYKDKVRVIDGFYKDEIGIIVLDRMWYNTIKCNEPSYEVRLEDVTIHIPEKYLEAL